MGKKLPYAIPSIGQIAWDFKLPATTGKTISLHECCRENTIVLYFYPKADTPGCTTQACAFRDAGSEYQKAGAIILGVSPDPIAKAKKFADKYKLNFPLLADEDHSISERYGVWQEKSMYGRKYWGVVRTTFVIDKKGTIQHVFEKVKPAGHEEQVLGFLNAKSTHRNFKRLAEAGNGEPEVGFP